MRKILFALLLIAIQIKAQVFDDEQWLALLHINKTTHASEIQDNNFFVSKDRTPESEYKAHLNILNTDKACETICRYPARYAFLKDRLDLNISFAHCKDLNLFLEKSKGDEASIVFASSYLESPISYFGHIFIKIDNPNNMFSQTVGYAAEVPQNTGFIKLVAKGISGGFTGKYAANEYFKIIENYGNIEQRAITEYKLNLKQPEVNMMKLHMYEMFGVDVPYKFFTENCAYEVLWLLDVARPSLRLTKEQSSIVVPYRILDTLNKKNIVTQRKTRESQISDMYDIYQSLDRKEKSTLGNILESESPMASIKSDKDTNDDTKNKYLYLLNGYYDILFKKYGRSKSDYSEVKTTVYKPPIKTKHDVYTNGSSKVELSKAIGSNTMHLNIKPYLLDRKIDKVNELGEASLKFFEMEASSVQHKNTLEKVNFIDIESINTMTPFYRQPSWALKIGYDKPFKDKNQILGIEFGIGKTVEYSEVKYYLLGYISTQPTQEAMNIGAAYGISYWVDNKTHMGFDAKSNIAYLNKKTKDRRELYLVHNINKNAFVKLSTREYEGVLLGMGAKF